jgi:uncharacterized protein involved in outer membrane biogenesis
MNSTRFTVYQQEIHMAHRPSRRLVITTGVIVCLIGAFIVVLPEIIRRVAVNRLENFFTVPVSIKDVDVNLFTGRAAIENLVIGGKQPPPILSLSAADIEFSRTALLSGKVMFSNMLLQQPELLIERVGPNTYNIVKALRTSEKAPQENGIGGFGFSIRHLEIQSGDIIFIDRTQEPDYKLSLSSVSFAAGPISILPQASDTPTTFRAGVNIGEGSLIVSGSTKDLGKPLTVELKAEISNVELQRFDVYLPYGERLNLENSLLNGHLRYVNTSETEITSEHYLNADLQIGGGELMAALGSQPIFQISGLAARNMHIDFLKNTAVVGALAIEEPYLLVKRDSAGFNFQHLLPDTDTEVPESSGNEAAGNQISLTIKQVEADNGAVEFVDQTVDPNVNSLLQELHLEAGDVQILPNFAAAQINGQARLGDGSLGVTGSLGEQSFAGQFVITAEKLPFHPFQGYLDQLFDSAKSSGEQIGGRLRLKLITDNDRQPRMEISGGLEGRDMALRFADQKNPFLTTERLGVELRSITFGSNPQVDLDQINFTGANLRVVRNQDGNLHLTRLWAADEQQKSEPNKNETKGSNGEAGTTVAIRLISVDRSNIGIVDRSVSPNYDTKLSGVSGKLTNIRPGARRAELKLEGILGDSAKLRLSGWFTPYAKQANMQFEGTIRSYALPPLNPYATEYVSHRIERGQITMDVNYTMKQGQVKAVADVVLRQVRVGERTGDDFITRIGIPLELAVALLEDVNGVIQLRLAMSGESGIKLNVASLIWDAVRNAIVRAITAPFRLVGNILTLGGKVGQVRIDPIPFEPGTREIPPRASEQIIKLAELLNNKPKLDLKIVGGASRAEVDYLKQKKFWEMLASTAIKDYQEALIELYRNMGGAAKPAAPLDAATEESLERYVMQRVSITEEDLRELGRDRAELVKRQLVQRGVDPERLSAAAPEYTSNNAKPEVEIELVS